MNAFKITLVILTTLCLIPGLYLRYLPFRSLISGNRKKALIAVYGILLLLNVFIIGSIHMFVIENVITTSWLTRSDYIIFGILGVLINMFFIKGHVREHLFVYGVVIIVNYTSLTLASFISLHFHILNPTRQYMIGTVIFIILIFITILPTKLMLKRTVEPFLTLEGSTYWRSIWFIPMGMFYSMFLLTGLNDNISTWNELISRFLIFCTTLVMCYIIMTDYKGIMEKQFMEKQLYMSKVHYAELQFRVEKARKTKHDMKHLITAVRQYIENDDRVGLAEFCDDMEEQNGSRLAIPYTGNAAADGVIWHYMLQAEEKQIQFKYKGVIRNHNIADIDLCVLLGNALDNAFTGCMNLPEKERKVTVVSQTEEHLLSIMIHNTFDGKMAIKDKTVLSRKRNEKRTGVGLMSMKEICEKYGGALEIKWDEKTFTGIMMLPIS